MINRFVQSRTVRWRGSCTSNKFGNKSCRCISNHIHHSRAEASYCTELEYRKKAKDIKDYKTQHRIDIRISGVHICNYYADFLVTHNDDTQEVIEVKGFAVELGMMKFKIAQALYTDDKLRFTMVMV